MVRVPSLSNHHSTSLWSQGDVGVSSARRTARFQGSRRLALCALLALVGGCGKGLAGGLAPDFEGVWDVTYDDSMQVEFVVEEQVFTTRLDEPGGRVVVRDAGIGLEFEVDCSRPELVCPSEVWPRELGMAHSPGKLDGDGVQLSESLVGAGQGRCLALDGSAIHAEVMAIATAKSIRTEAVALTAGQVSVVVDAACFAPHAGLPAGAQVLLRTGFTAAKR